jgi:hypothetical protein
MGPLDHGDPINPILITPYRRLTFGILQSIPFFMTQEGTGKALLAVGIVFCLAGGLLWGFGDRLKWLGHLPGDFSYEGPNFKFYFPLTTILLLNGVFWLLLKLKEWFSK